MVERAGKGWGISSAMMALALQFDDVAQVSACFFDHGFQIGKCLTDLTFKIFRYQFASGRLQTDLTRQKHGLAA